MGIEGKKEISLVDLARNKTAQSARGASAEALMFDLQVEQHFHDETYHREISRLSLHQRLNHMALHFAKYTGKFAEGPDDNTRIMTVVDVLVIALSTANVLNVRLWDLVEPQKRHFLDLTAFGRSVAQETGDYRLSLHNMARATGRIAAACEKIDHLEEINFREEVRVGLAELSKQSLSFLACQSIEPDHAVRRRLNGVKQRLELHGRI